MEGNGAAWKGGDARPLFGAAPPAVLGSSAPVGVARLSRGGAPSAARIASLALLFGFCLWVASWSLGKGDQHFT